MKSGWIALATIGHVMIIAAQKCNLTYIDEGGHFPLAVDNIPPAECPKTNDCCWCSFGNMTSGEAWCCVTTACNATTTKSFETFAQSLCTANMGITGPGKVVESCPQRGKLLNSLNLMTSITAESADPSTSSGGSVPTNKTEESVNDKISSKPEMADKRKTAIAVSASLVGITIIALVSLFLWRQRRARKAMFEELHSKSSELPTESNTHEIEGRAMEKAPLNNSKPHEIMSRSVESLSTAPIWENENTSVRIAAEMKRLAGRSVSDPLLFNRSPDTYSPIDGRASFALCSKPLPPPPPPMQARKKGVLDTQKALPKIRPSPHIQEYMSRGAPRRVPRACVEIVRDRKVVGMQPGAEALRVSSIPSRLDERNVRMF